MTAEPIRQERPQQLTLVEPDAEYAAAFCELAEEFHAAGETYYEEELELIREDCPAFIEKLRGFARGEGLPQGYVPASEFWLLEPATGKILGTIRLRHALTPDLLEYGGHIGYCVRPGTRRRGCGTRMLALLLEKLNDPAWQRAHRVSMDRVLVTCSVDNLASARIIEANGGVLENRVWLQGVQECRYWVNLHMGDDANEPG